MRNFLQRIKAAFERFIETCENLIKSLEANSEKLEALAATQLSLHAKFDTLIAQGEYMLDAKRKQLMQLGILPVVIQK